MTLAVLCPGQGAQHADMFQWLEGHAAAESVLELASSVVGSDIRKLAAEPQQSQQNRYAQPLICAAEMATWRVLSEMLPTPRVFAGYSVGELAAYGCAGALDAEALVTLAMQRARFMDEASEIDTGLVAVRGLEKGQLLGLNQTAQAEIAIKNGGDQFVVGMPRDQLLAYCTEVELQGGKAQVLPVSVASHTPWMTTAAAVFADVLRESPLQKPSVPVLGGIHGLPVYTRDRAIQTLSGQLATTIDWAACLETLKEYGCSAVLELGPGSALSRMAQAVMPRTPVHSVADFRSLDAVAQWVAKQD